MVPEEGKRIISSRDRSRSRSSDSSSCCGDSTSSSTSKRSNLHLRGDASEQILHGTVRVVKTCSQGSFHLTLLVTHVLDVLDHPIIVLPHHQPRVVVHDWLAV